MLIGRVKRALAGTLVRATTATRAYARADWSTVLESEAIDFENAVAPPFVPEASYLDPEHCVTPQAVTAPIDGVLYYSYLNVLMTPRRSILLETDNIYLEHPRTATADMFYWKDLYFGPLEDIPGVSFLLRSPANNYYHTLVDNLPRLYALQQPRYRETQITLLVPGSLQRFEEHFLSRLLPDNVQIRTVERDRLHRLETVIFGSYLSRQMCGYLPRKYLAFFLERVLPARPRKKGKRIYVTRRPSRVGRRVLNEEEVLRVTEGFGFEPYALEELSLSDQIDLFFDAEAVVAPHGAGLTNLLFSDRVGVVELHPTRTVFPHYYFLCQAMGHRYRYVCADASTRHSDFVVDTKAVAENLSELLA